MTQIIRVNKTKPEPEKLSAAAKMLASGGTVVFPTETVYGLGANALDEYAVKKIFTAKGRPSDNPLIVHIYDFTQLDKLASTVPASFFELAGKFWPGPLTMVVKKSPLVPDLVTAGLDTVGIRMPNHPVALELIKQSGVPVAAPSANVSGLPSPTKAEHVINDLDGKVDIIIDGGDCLVGLESTVLDIAGDTPVILRPGGITPEQIEAVLGKVMVDRFVYERFKDQDSNPRSPGIKYRHYSPKAEVILVEGSLTEMAAEINTRSEYLINNKKRVGIMATDQTRHMYAHGTVMSLGDRDRPETIAGNLFGLLRYFDQMGVDVILAESIDRTGIGIAVMNRMVRAAGYNIVGAGHAEQW